MINIHLLCAFGFVSVFCHVFSSMCCLIILCMKDAPFGSKGTMEKLEKGNYDDEQFLDNLLPLLHLGLYIFKFCDV